MSASPRRLRLVTSFAAIGLIAGAVFAAVRATIGVAQVVEEPATAPTTTITPQDARPLSVRGGIGNFAAKLRDGRDVTIAFLGGPITFGGGDRGFVELLINWLRVNHSRSHVRLVNAGFIDPGSPLGAARYERDVLPHEPDLLLVEFAADDAGKDDRTRFVERIVHKAWEADPTLDLVFVYALHEADRDAYRGGKFPPAASVFERVAEHYGIPSIAMGIELLNRVEAGKAKWPDLFYDAWRPKPAAHALYGEALIGAIQAMLADETAKTASKHELKAPLTANLVIRPATRPATTMPAPPPMRLDDGSVARATYTMPIIGTHWVGSPEYVDADGRVLWRLFSQSARANGRRLNPTFGLDRSRWTGPMRWFEEWRQFTGPAGAYLAHSTSGKGNNLTAREDDLPVVTFTAPRSGRYVVRMRSGGVAMWGFHRSLAMNIVHFPAGQTKGTSIAYHRTQAGLSETPNLQAEVRLGEGDEIAFEVDTNATSGGGGAAYQEVDVTIGWFRE